ncbi:hypothetical protein ABK040_014102 [Willaertia magna]
MSGEEMQWDLDDSNDPFFSEQAKESYKTIGDQNNSNLTSNNNGEESFNHDNIQWKLPDAEGGAYLNKLEQRLNQIQSKRTRGGFQSHNKSSVRSRTNKNAIEVIGSVEDEDEEEGNVIGNIPLVENDQEEKTNRKNEPQSLDEEEEKNKSSEFEDLQQQEIEEMLWEHDVFINSEDKPRRMYDLKTGDLVPELKKENSELKRKEESEDEEEELEGNEEAEENTGQNIYSNIHEEEEEEELQLEDEK